MYGNLGKLEFKTRRERHQSHDQSHEYRYPVRTCNVRVPDLARSTENAVKFEF